MPFVVLLGVGLLVHMHFDSGWMESIGLKIQTSPLGLRQTNWHTDVELKWHDIREMRTTKQEWRIVTRATTETEGVRFDNMLRRWMTLRDTICSEAGLELVPGTERAYEGVWRASDHEGE